MKHVKSIDDVQRQQVIDETTAWIRKAETIFDQSFALIPVGFDLRGRAAGMYRVSNGHRVIRYNPWLFARYFEDNLANTVPHEVAHYIIDMVYGHKLPLRPVEHQKQRRLASRHRGLFSRRDAETNHHVHRVRPHGKEWRSLMITFGADASRTCNYDLEGIPVRTQKYHYYYCSCTAHRLGARRHNKIRNKTARYFCRKCRGELCPQETAG